MPVVWRCQPTIERSLLCIPLALGAAAVLIDGLAQHTSHVQQIPWGEVARFPPAVRVDRGRRGGRGEEGGAAGGGGCGTLLLSCSTKRSACTHLQLKMQEGQ